MKCHCGIVSENSSYEAKVNSFSDGYKKQCKDSKYK
jgi:hypothetical protein